jgi:hypothetical protein
LTAVKKFSLFQKRSTPGEKKSSPVEIGKFGEKKTPNVPHKNLPHP